MTHSVENGFGAPCAPLPDGTHALSFAPPPQKKTEGIRNPKHGSSELRLGPPVTCACPSVPGHTFYLQDFKVNSSLRVTGFPIGHVSVEESQLRFQGSEARLKLPPSGSALSDERVSLEEV